MAERTSLLKTEAIADLACRIVDAEAQELMKAKHWLAAIQVYQQGLEKYPDNHLLLNNLAYAKQESKESNDLEVLRTTASVTIKL